MHTSMCALFVYSESQAADRPLRRERIRKKEGSKDRKRKKKKRRDERRGGTKKRDVRGRYRE